MGDRYGNDDWAGRGSAVEGRMRYRKLRIAWSVRTDRKLYLGEQARKRVLAAGLRLGALLKTVNQ